MLKVDITIPLFYNDNKPIESYKFDTIKHELIGNYGGLTETLGLKGYWIKDNKMFKDYNILYTVICDNNKDNIKYFKDLKIRLESIFRQYEIFIIMNEVNKIE